VPGRLGWRGPWLLVGGGAILAAVIALVAVRLAGSGASSVVVAPNSLVAIDPRTNGVAAATPAGSRPGAVAFGSGSLWVANVDDQTVSRIDPGSLRTLRILPVPDPPTGLAATANAIWVAQSNAQASTVSVNRIDPQFYSLGPTLRVGNIVPGGPAAVAAHGNTVWVAPSSGLLTPLDPATGRGRHPIDPNSGPTAIAVGDGAAWVTDTEANNVTRVDATGLLTPIAVGNAPSGIAVNGDGVWVADSLDNAVVRIDLSTQAVTSTIRVGRSPNGVAVGAGSVWVANSGDGTVTRIDPRTEKIISTIGVGGSPQAITVANGRAWVTVDAQSIRPSEGLSGGGTLRIAAQLDVDYMDPALAYLFNSSQLLYAAPARTCSTTRTSRAWPARS
jgi:YVTN family beta-propeller protein